MKVIIYWFRNDLRLLDNPALTQACKEADCLLPIYVHDPATEAETAWHFSRVAHHRKTFLRESLADLKVNLQYSTSSDVPRFDRLTELSDETDISDLKFAEWYYGPQNRLLISSQLLIHPNKSWIENGALTVAYQNIGESRIQRKFGSLNRSYREEKVNIFSVNGDFSVSLNKEKKRAVSYGFEFAYNDVISNSYGKTLNISNGEINGFSDDFNVQSRYPDGGSNYLSSAVYAGYKQDINKKSTLNTGIRFTNTNLNATWFDERFSP